MDGQVDQVYECKNQTCERQYQVVNGKPQRLVRTIASGPDEIIEMYEDKNGKLELVKKTTRPAMRAEFSRDPNGNAATEGDFCFDCYEERRSDLIEMVLKLRPDKGIFVPKRNLKQVGSFFESRSGVLIHEECFEQYGEQVEQWVTDATVEGLSCHINTETSYKNRTGNRGKSYYSHIPRLMNLFTKDSQGGAFKDGMLLNMDGKTELFENPCEDYKSVPLNLESKIHKNNCEFDGRFNLTQPKIICQADQLELAINEYNGATRYADASVTAYATNPNGMRPVFVNWKNKTEVYNHPVISFVPRGRKLNETQFKATFWHELLHNCGYSHDDEGHPDYAYFCATACFSKSYNFSAGIIDGARAQCETSEKNDGSMSQLETIRRVIGTH